MISTALAAIGLFAVCFFMLGVGFFLRGVVLKGSCGGAAQALGEDASCGACAKKEKEMCPSDDMTGLLDVSQVSNPHRPLKERPRDPGFQV